MTIDDGTLDDVDAVAHIEHATMPGPRPLDVVAQQVREELGHAFSRLWIARGEAREVRAFLHAWHVVDELSVLTVATHPACRRNGHARELMEHALAYARASSVAVLLLEVRRSNTPAIALYRAFRFEVVRERARYYEDGEDAFEMLRVVDA